MTIDLKKTYRTRDGYETRLYANDGEGLFPIHGAYLYPNKGWVICKWTKDGNLNAATTPTFADLIEVKPERWHPIIKFSQGFAIGNVVFSTREEALSFSSAVDAWKAPNE